MEAKMIIGAERIKKNKDSNLSIKFFPALFLKFVSNLLKVYMKYSKGMEYVHNYDTK